MVIALALIIAVAVALGVYGLVQIVFYASDGDRRKLHERLSAHVGELSPHAHQSIIRQAEQDSLSSSLAEVAPFRALHRTLAQSFPELSLVRFLAVVAAAGLLAGVLVLLVTMAIPAALVAGVLGGYIPFVVLTARRVRRQKMLDEQLPDALDFLSRIMRAGHSLTTGLQMMGEELPEPLAGEFRRCYAQHSLGHPLEDALRDMALRVDSTDFAFLVTAILIQRQTGGDLSEVLGNIGSMIRQRVRLQQHVKAKTAEGRLTGYILVGFAPLMFVVCYMLDPNYAGNMLADSVGKTLLVAAAVLQVLGLLAIRKITTVRV